MESPKNEAVKEKYNVGVAVLILLAAITIGEFGIAVVGKNIGAILMLIAVLKAFFIIRDYMHFGRLFSEEEE